MRSSPAELEAIRSGLRKMRDKEQTLSRQKRREARGKSKGRGASFPGTAERPSQRKQIFAAALKRVNKELERLHNLAARTAHVEAARRALALHRAANFIPYPSAGATASEGMVRCRYPFFSVRLQAEWQAHTVCTQKPAFWINA